MTYETLNRISGAWGFTLGSIAGDMMRNAKWGYTKKAFKTAQVTNHEIETLIFWAKKEGVDLRVSIDLAFAGIELNHRGICSMCRRDQPIGYHVHACE